jgi:hypothetical protein
MRRKANDATIKVTHRYVHNPEAAERGMELWASYLARHVRKQLAEEEKVRREPTP